MERSFARSQVNFMAKTLLHMGLGLLFTFIAAVTTQMFIRNINPAFMIAAFVVEFALVFYLSARINRLTVAKATFWFYVYAALNGFTLSTVLSSYGFGMATRVFLFTSAMFFCSAMIGMTTKRNLSSLGQFFMMLLVGVLIISVFQIFVPLKGLNFIIAILGIITFCGLTAYDMQRIKYFHQQSYGLNPEEVSKYAIISALGLYLNFINLFLYVLRLFRDE